MRSGQASQVVHDTRVGAQRPDHLAPSPASPPGYSAAPWPGAADSVGVTVGLIKVTSGPGDPFRASVSAWCVANERMGGRRRLSRRYSLRRLGRHASRSIGASRVCGTTSPTHPSSLALIWHCSPFARRELQISCMPMTWLHLEESRSCVCYSPCRRLLRDIVLR